MAIATSRLQKEGRDQRKTREEEGTAEEAEENEGWNGEHGSSGNTRSLPWNKVFVGNQMLSDGGKEGRSEQRREGEMSS